MRRSRRKKSKYRLPRETRPRQCWLKLNMPIKWLWQLKKKESSKRRSKMRLYSVMFSRNNKQRWRDKKVKGELKRRRKERSQSSERCRKRQLTDRQTLTPYELRELSKKMKEIKEE